MDYDAGLIVGRNGHDSDPSSLLEQVVEAC